MNEMEEMNVKKILALVLALMLCMSAAVAEGSLLNMDSMFPVVNEPVELEFCIVYDSSMYGEWEDLWWWHYMEENTGVTIVPRLIAKDVWKEQSMIMLSSGDLPDVFFYGGWSPAEIYEYGLQDGIFIPLTEYVNDAELMPNLTAAFEMYPEAKADSTLPDGNIYGLPYMMSDYYVTASGYRAQWHTAWLNDIGIEDGNGIETLDEFYNALLAIRDADHNGNGQADEIPWSTYWGTDGKYGMNYVVGYILNALGLATGDGLVAVNYNTGEAGYAPMMEEYYDALVFLNKLYAEGLIDTDMFSQTDADMCAKFGAGLSAFSTHWNPGGCCTAEEWDAHTADNYGDTVLTYQKPMVDVKGETPIQGVSSKHGMNVFCITMACENPEVAMRWADSCYDLRTSMYYRCGPIFGSEDDDWKIGLSVDLENHKQNEYHEAREITGETDLSGYQWIQCHINSSASVSYFGLDETLGHRKYVDPLMYEPGIAPQWTDNYTRSIAPYEVDLYPNMYFTEEQNKVIELYKTSLDEYVIEMTAKFIAGENTLNEETWAEFQKSMEAYNGAEYNTVLFDAYEAYKANA